MTTLIITNRLLRTASNGYDLRVWHLCRALAEHERLVLLTLPIAEGSACADGELFLDQVFANRFSSIRMNHLRPRFLRHFRLGEDSRYRLGYPSFQRAVTDQIKLICRQFAIENMIVFGSNLVGLTREFSTTKKMLLDVCDSVALTIEREMAIDDNRTGPVERLKKQLNHARWKNLEGKTPYWFDHVVTINQRDTETVQRLSGGRTNLSTIPNGVEPVFEQAYHEVSRKRRGVAFWGNLSFAPNRDAVKFFYDDVYLPYLKPVGIEWCIVGKDPAPYLLEAAAHDNNLRLLGFVEDLRETLVDYPVMVNPMRSGSGMKNKVLEAHAMGLAVVSTPLGMESIDGATADASYLAAQTPRQFFNAVQALLENEKMRVRIQRTARDLVMNKYTWKTVDAQWVHLVSRVFPSIALV